jgi:hypothetical protein
LAAAGGFGFVYFTKRNRKEEPTDHTVEHLRSNASEVGTYPSQASVYEVRTSKMF